MIEIAICLAIIGIALVAIIGVLPRGMDAQKLNRQITVINQDATVFIEAIRNGARGLDDLTNYVYAITNHWTLYIGGVVAGTGVNGYDYNSSTVTWPLSVGNCRLTSGFHIVGLLTTPEFTGTNGFPTNNLFSGGYSNHIVAYVRSMSGPAVEKPPQDSDLLLNASFGYRILCVNAPVATDTNAPVNSPYYKQLAANLHELRLTFLWPTLPNGGVGNERQTFRILAAGDIQHLYTNNVDLYFYQSQSFTNAP